MNPYLCLYTVILVFMLILESCGEQKSYWDPCTEGRSSFDGIVSNTIDEKQLHCACRDGFFGEKCSLKGRLCKVVVKY